MNVCMFMCHLLHVHHMCAMPTENGVVYSTTEVTDGLRHNLGLRNQTGPICITTITAEPYTQSSYRF